MTNVKSPMLGPTLDAMGSEDVETLKSRLRARLPADSRGQITYGARACGERSPEVIGKDRPWRSAYHHWTVSAPQDRLHRQTWKDVRSYLRKLCGQRGRLGESLRGPASSAPPTS